MALEIISISKLENAPGWAFLSKSSRIDWSICCLPIWSKFPFRGFWHLKISFPNFYIFAFGKNPEYVQSTILIGIKGELPISEEGLYQKLLVGENNFLADKIIPVASFKNSPFIILTDNFSPVEKLMEPTIKSYFPQNLFVLKSILSIWKQKNHWDKIF